MRRAWLLLCFLLVGTAQAARPRATEALQVLTDYMRGKISRNQALNRIEFLGQQDYVSFEVLQMLKRAQDPRQRAQLLEFMVDVGGRHPDVETELIRTLKSDTPVEQLLAARGLGRMKSDDAVKPLLPVLGSESAALRREAAVALGSIGRPAAGAALMKAVSKESELEVKVAELQAVGAVGDRKQLPALEALLQDSSESTRLAAGRSLCVMGAPRCRTYAETLLSAKDPSSRMLGVMLFDGSKAKFAAPVLKPVLADADHKLRARAARLLAEGGDKAQLEWLVIESYKAKLEDRLVYEDELERLRLTDEDRTAILRKAGLK